MVVRIAGEYWEEDKDGNNKWDERKRGRELDAVLCHKKRVSLLSCREVIALVLSLIPEGCVYNSQCDTVHPLPTSSESCHVSVVKVATSSDTLLP